MDKKIKIAFITVVALMIAAVLFGIGYAIWEQASAIPTKYENYADIIPGEGLKNTENVTPNEYYIADVKKFGSNNIFMQYHDGEYSFSVGKELVASGNYDIDGNLVSVKYQLDTDAEVDSSILQLMLYEDKVFFVSSICSGDIIPDSKTFNAVVSRRSTNNEAYQYTFHDDGSYELLYGKRRGRTNWNTVKGHYTVNDDGTISRTLINVKTGDENETLPIMIYNGHIVDSYYVAITEEEYLANISIIE